VLRRLRLFIRSRRQDIPNNLHTAPILDKILSETVICGAITVWLMVR
jgi:hypothetical protein